MSTILGLCLVWIFVQLACAQTHPSTVPVPPLQWIRLKPTNVGPALSFAAGGFDYINNQLVIFGGETSGGLIDANTHLLDMATMAWTSPSPTINKNVKPPGRSRALAGHDIIASYRNGLLVYGGLGQSGPLSDVWEYNFSGQFWYNVTNIEGDIPPARYDATGGGDPPNVSNADTNLLTTFWLTGGVEAAPDGSARPASYDDIYRLQLSGTVAGNIQNPKATWKKVATVNSGNANPRLGQAGLVLRTAEGEAKLGFYGGCVSTTNASVSCAQQDAHIVGTASGGQWDDIAACPSARIGGAFVPNLNHLFSDMAFLLLGLSPSTNTTNVYELGTRGEVDILSISQGVWARVLPSCDPGSDPPCPVPRQGAVVISSPNTVAGASGSSAASAASDIIVFGGKDKDGNVLSDVWILRATTARTTYTNQTNWDSLYGNGVLGSGVGTNGQGVTVEFLTECAAANQPGPTGSDNPSGPSNGSSNNNPIATPIYISGTSHKILAACSVVVVLLASALWRAVAPSGQASDKGNSGSTWLVLSVMIVAWVMGIVGFATSFTTTQRGGNLAKRDDSKGIGFVATSHAIVGCILFALAYVLAPVIILGNQWMTRRVRTIVQPSSQVASDAGEKEPNSRGTTTPLPNDHLSGPTNGRLSPSHRRKSLSVHTMPNAPGAGDNSRPVSAGTGGTGAEHDDEPVGAGKRIRLGQRRLSAPSAFFKEQLWPGKSWGDHTRKRERLSSHPSPPTSTSPLHSPVASTSSAAPLVPSPESTGGGTGFVVLNRGKHALDRRTPPPIVYDQHQRRVPMTLAEVSWLERRRNVHLVNELDYALSHHHAHTSPAVTPTTQYTRPFHSSPSEADAELARMRMASSSYQGAGFPSTRIVLLHCSFHLLLLALSIFTATSIFLKADSMLATPLGAVFVVLVAAFYILMIVLAIRGKPRGSITAVIINRLRANGEAQKRASAHDIKLEEHSPAAPEDRHGAGDHSVMGETTTLKSSTRASRAFIQHSRYSEEILNTRGQEAAAHTDDEDEAESIEREMGRRDVSIVTVPKRRLFIANSDAA